MALRWLDRIGNRGQRAACLVLLSPTDRAGLFTDTILEELKLSFEVARPLHCKIWNSVAHANFRCTVARGADRSR